MQLDSRDGEARETFEPGWPGSLWLLTLGLLSALDCSCILSIKSEHSFNLRIQPGESALTEGEVARLLLNDVLSSVELRQLVQCHKHAAILPSCKVPHLHQRINPKQKYWDSPPAQCHRAFQGVGLAPPRTNPPCRQRSQPRIKTGLGRKVVQRKNQLPIQGSEQFRDNHDPDRECLSPTHGLQLSPGKEQRCERIKDV